MISSVGSYRIEGELARGGMGVVYRARGPQGPCALKVLQRGQLDARFRQEVEVARRLRHPAIVPVIDAGDTDSGQPYLVMELVEGEDLGAVLKRQPQGLPPLQALEIALALAEGLAHAHAQGVIHRDLKPANVILTPGGRPRLVDFGVAKRLDRLEQLTRTGELLGTPAYMAPEQARSQRDAIGPATDVYALGALLYALLTGRSPFPGRNPIQQLHALLHREPKPPTALRPGLDPRLEAICLRCLAKAPADRYPSATALADALRAARPQAPSSSRAGARGAGRWLAPAAALVALALSAALGGAWRLSQARSVAPVATSGRPAEVTPPPRRDPGPLAAAVLARRRDFEQGLLDFESAAAALAEIAQEARAKLARGPDADAHLALAEHAQFEGMRSPDAFDRALVHAQRAQELAPRDPHAQLSLGRLRLQPGLVNPAQAQRHFRLALQFLPRSPEALIGLALAQHTAGDVESALVTLQEALELAPQLALPWEIRGRWRARLNDRPAALSDLDRAVTLAPQRWITRVFRASLLALEQRPQDAAADLEGVGADGRLAGTISCVRALIALQLREHADVERWCQEALRADPALPEALGILARDRLAALVQQGPLPADRERLEPIAALVRVALRRDPKNRHALLTRCQLDQLVGDLVQAGEGTQRLLATDPTWAPGLVMLGQVRLARREPDLAREAFQRALKAPGLWPPWAELGIALALLQEHRFEAAKRSAEEVLARGEHPMAYDVVATALRETGDHAAALSAVNRSLELLQTAQSLMLRASILDPLGRPREALADLERAVELAPNLSEIRERRDALLRQLGN